MKEYNFDVNFTIPIEAESYDQAVRKADKQFPDEDGMTTFIIETEEYGFVPSKETLDNMHEWRECSCHTDKTNLEKFENATIFSDFINNSESLTLKNEMIFGAVINSAYIAVLLGFNLQQAREMALIQASLFKITEHESGPEFKQNLWKRDEGIEISEFINNMMTLYSFIKLNSEIIFENEGENHIFDYLTKVKSVITTYSL